MLHRTFFLTSLLLLSACATSTDSIAIDDQMDHSESSTMQEPAKDRLIDSPRHQEWVDISNGDKEIYTFVVYPERSTPAPVVLLIHENRGLTDWVRSTADRLAEEGYIVVAPDLLSGFSEQYTRTIDFPDEDAAIASISQLKQEAVLSDLEAVITWSKTIPAADTKVISAGFCWGGSQSFALATSTQELNAALVFYGSGPKDESSYANIAAPVYGFYGTADERIGATIPASEEAMKKFGKTYDIVSYDGAGHAFMRLGEDPNGTPANVTAREEAWERMKSILAGL